MNMRSMILVIVMSLYLVVSSLSQRYEDAADHVKTHTVDGPLAAYLSEDSSNEDITLQQLQQEDDITQDSIEVVEGKRINLCSSLSFTHFPLV